jgi:hypothetical protein
MVSSGVGNQLPLGLGSVSTLDPAGLVMLVTLLAILVAAVGTLSAAGDRPRPRARLVAWLSLCNSTTTRALSTA